MGALNWLFLPSFVSASVMIGEDGGDAIKKPHEKVSKVLPSDVLRD